MKRTPFILLLGIIIFIAIAAYAGFQFYQKSSLENQVEQLDKQISDNNAEFLNFQNQKLNQAISAKQVVNNVKDTGVRWSKVIKAIRVTIPEEEDVPLAEVIAYSAANNSGISLNLRTAVDTENPYLDVASVIKSFDESKYFVESFVPSIAANSDDEGREFLNFVINFKYSEKENTEEKGRKEPRKEELEEVISKIIEGETSEEQPSVPVPR